MMSPFLKTLSIAGLSLTLVASCVQRKSPPAPVVQLGTTIESQHGAITINQGDNLYNISKRYRLSLPDIIYLNEIAAPYEVTPGQRLKLPPPREHIVAKGDSLYRLGRMYNMSVAEISRRNNLSPPYHLELGQKLRVSSLRTTDLPTARDENITTIPKTLSGPSARPSSTSTTPKSQSTLASKVTSTSKRPTLKGGFVWPIDGRVVSHFGAKKGGLHNDGINIAAPKGTSVKSANAGEVIYTGSKLSGFGNLVLIGHANGWVTAYSHLDEIAVQRGQIVKRGHMIGSVGATGRVKTPQLHFELRRGREAINPTKHLPEI